MAARHGVADVSEIAVGRGRVFEVAGKQIAVFNLGERFVAMDNLCPHRGGPLADGVVNGNVVTCPWHGWMFDCTNGKSTRNAAVCVTSYAVSVDGTTLYVEA